MIILNISFRVSTFEIEYWLLSRTTLSSPIKSSLTMRLLKELLSTATTILGLSSASLSTLMRFVGWLKELRYHTQRYVGCAI